MNQSPDNKLSNSDHYQGFFEELSKLPPKDQLSLLFYLATLIVASPGTLLVGGVLTAQGPEVAENLPLDITQLLDFTRSIGIPDEVVGPMLIAIGLGSAVLSVRKMMNIFKKSN